MNRDLAIDATRGLAIWSMITAHFATGASIARPTHAFPYVDGMSVFVLLSGFVLGLVYHRWIDQHGLRFAYWRLSKRIVVLYLCQFTIAVVAVAAALAGHRWLTLLLPVDSWAHGLNLAASMSYLPSGGNILLLYLMLMASAYLLFPILMRGGWWVVVAASIALYVVSLIHSPGWFFLTADMAAPRIQNWAGWQVMFVPAVVVGWKWRQWDLAARIDRWLPLIVATALAVALTFHYAIEVGPLASYQPWLGDKLGFGPARAVGAWVAVPAVYGLVRLFLRHCHHDWLRPLVMSGTRSLDSYVLQAIALIVVPIHVAHRPWNPTTEIAVTLLVFGCCWAWAEFRSAAHVDKLHRLPVLIAQQMPSISPARATSHSGVPRTPQTSRPLPPFTRDLPVAALADAHRPAPPQAAEPNPSPQRSGAAPTQPSARTRELVSGGHR